ncbi:MAG: hypothetical protein Q8937_07710 [Bacteroidota bacterium]|nr:hypothetical protein [Bacteroidota bacterium]
MSLNDIDLPALAISELYKGDVLVGGTPDVREPDVREPDLQGPYRRLGDNKRNITILVDSPESPFLPDEQLTFLTKMLEACKLTIGDVAIVNLAGAPVKVSALKAQLSPTIILLFGPGPADIELPLHFPMFKMQAYDRCTYLSAPSLGEIGRPTEEGKLLKSKLWVCLKALFQL